MTVIIVLGILCFVSAFFVAWFEVKRKRRQMLVAKLTASLLFCAAGILALSIRGKVDFLGALMLSALVLGLAGDIYLALFSFIKREHAEFFYKVGGGAFLFGHVLYVIAMVSAGSWRLALTPIVFVVLVVYLVLMRTKTLRPASMKGSLLVYAVVLGGMVTAGINLALDGSHAGPLVVPAGILFILSDTALFLHDFGNERVRARRAPLNYTIMLCYFTAQILFAASIVFI